MQSIKKAALGLLLILGVGFVFEAFYFLPVEP